MNPSPFLVALADRLSTLRHERGTLHAFGWTDTPALDAEIASVEQQIRDRIVLETPKGGEA